MSNKSFEELYTDYQWLVHKIIFDIMKSKLSYGQLSKKTDDLVQDTFEKVRVNMKKADISTPENERNWIAKIAQRIAFNEIRRKVYEKEVLTDFEDMYKMPDTLNLSVLEKIEMNETKDEVWNEVRKLPEQYSTAIIMKYQFGFTNMEIAKALCVTYNNATVILNRGLGKLTKSKKIQSLKEDHYA